MESLELQLNQSPISFYGVDNGRNVQRFYVFCAYCEKQEGPKERFKTCLRCKQIHVNKYAPIYHYYCSRECQRSHWVERHRAEHVMYEEIEGLRQQKAAELRSAIKNNEAGNSRDAAVKTEKTNDKNGTVQGHKTGDQQVKETKTGDQQIKESKTGDQQVSLSQNVSKGAEQAVQKSEETEKPKVEIVYDYDPTLSKTFRGATSKEGKTFKETAVGDDTGSLNSGVNTSTCTNDDGSGSTVPDVKTTPGGQSSKPKMKKEFTVYPKNNWVTLTSAGKDGVPPSKIKPSSVKNPKRKDAATSPTRKIDVSTMTDEWDEDAEKKDEPETTQRKDVKMKRSQRRALARSRSSRKDSKLLKKRPNTAAIAAAESAASQKPNPYLQKDGGRDQTVAKTSSKPSKVITFYASQLRMELSAKKDGTRTMKVTKDSSPRARIPFTQERMDKFLEEADKVLPPAPPEPEDGPRELTIISNDKDLPKKWAEAKANNGDPPQRNIGALQDVESEIKVIKIRTPSQEREQKEKEKYMKRMKPSSRNRIRELKAAQARNEASGVSKTADDEELGSRFMSVNSNDDISRVVQMCMEPNSDIIVKRGPIPRPKKKVLNAENRPKIIELDSDDEPIDTSQTLGGGRSGVLSASDIVSKFVHINPAPAKIQNPLQTRARPTSNTSNIQSVTQSKATTSAVTANSKQASANIASSNQNATTASKNEALPSVQNQTRPLDNTDSKKSAQTAVKQTPTETKVPSANNVNPGTQLQGKATTSTVTTATTTKQSTSVENTPSSQSATTVSKNQAAPLALSQAKPLDNTDSKKSAPTVVKETATKVSSANNVNPASSQSGNAPPKSTGVDSKQASGSASSKSATVVATTNSRSPGPVAVQQKIASRPSSKPKNVRANTSKKVSKQPSQTQEELAAEILKDTKGLQPELAFAVEHLVSAIQSGEFTPVDMLRASIKAANMPPLDPSSFKEAVLPDIEAIKKKEKAAKAKNTATTISKDSDPVAQNSSSQESANRATGKVATTAAPKSTVTTNPTSQSVPSVQMDAKQSSENVKNATEAKGVKIAAPQASLTTRIPDQIATSKNAIHSQVAETQHVAPQSATVITTSKIMDVKDTAPQTIISTTSARPENVPSKIVVVPKQMTVAATNAGPTMKTSEQAIPASPVAQQVAFTPVSEAATIAQTQMPGSVLPLTATAVSKQPTVTVTTTKSSNPGIVTVPQQVVPTPADVLPKNQAPGNVQPKTAKEVLQQAPITAGKAIPTPKITAQVSYASNVQCGPALPQQQVISTPQVGVTSVNKTTVAAPSAAAVKNSATNISEQTVPEKSTAPGPVVIPQQVMSTPSSQPTNAPSKAPESAPSTTVPMVQKQSAPEEIPATKITAEVSSASNVSPGTTVVPQKVVSSSQSSANPSGGDSNIKNTALTTPTQNPNATMGNVATQNLEQSVSASNVYSGTAVLPQQSASPLLSGAFLSSGNSYVKSTRMNLPNPDAVYMAITAAKNLDQSVALNNSTHDLGAVPPPIVTPPQIVSISSEGAVNIEETVPQNPSKTIPAKITSQQGVLASNLNPGSVSATQKVTHQTVISPIGNVNTNKTVPKPAPSTKTPGQALSTSNVQAAPVTATQKVTSSPQGATISPNGSKPGIVSPTTTKLSGNTNVTGSPTTEKVTTSTTSKTSSNIDPMGSTVTATSSTRVTVAADVDTVKSSIPVKKPAVQVDIPCAETSKPITTSTARTNNSNITGKVPVTASTANVKQNIAEKAPAHSQTANVNSSNNTEKAKVKIHTTDVSSSIVTRNRPSGPVTRLIDRSMVVYNGKMKRKANETGHLEDTFELECASRKELSRAEVRRLYLTECLRRYLIFRKKAVLIDSEGNPYLNRNGRFLTWEEMADKMPEPVDESVPNEVIQRKHFPGMSDKDVQEAKEKNVTVGDIVQYIEKTRDATKRFHSYATYMDYVEEWSCLELQRPASIKGRAVKVFTISQEVNKIRKRIQVSIQKMDSTLGEQIGELVNFRVTRVVPYESDRKLLAIEAVAHNDPVMPITQFEKDFYNRAKSGASESSSVNSQSQYMTSQLPAISGTARSIESLNLSIADQSQSQVHGEFKGQARPEVSQKNPGIEISKTTNQDVAISPETLISKIPTEQTSFPEHSENSAIPVIDQPGSHTIPSSGKFRVLNSSKEFGDICSDESLQLISNQPSLDMSKILPKKEDDSRPLDFDTIRTTPSAPTASSINNENGRNQQTPPNAIVGTIPKIGPIQITPKTDPSDIEKSENRITPRTDSNVTEKTEIQITPKIDPNVTKKTEIQITPKIDPNSTENNENQQGRPQASGIPHTGNSKAAKSNKKNVRSKTSEKKTDPSNAGAVVPYNSKGLNPRPAETSKKSAALVKYSKNTTSNQSVKEKRKLKRRQKAVNKFQRAFDNAAPQIKKVIMGEDSGDEYPDEKLPHAIKLIRQKFREERENNLRKQSVFTSQTKTFVMGIPTRDGKYVSPADQLWLSGHKVPTRKSKRIKKRNNEAPKPLILAPGRFGFLIEIRDGFYIYTTIYAMRLQRFVKEDPSSCLRNLKKNKFPAIEAAPDIE
uniref:uncharacterized protein LOC120332132 n=1 Tax=Styela clava TaxID=7725 RepID=UPI00193A89E8|nr:uncharacterized protein LOC120332132 [Styela clava]